MRNVLERTVRNKRQPKAKLPAEQPRFDRVVRASATRPHKVGEWATRERSLDEACSVCHQPAGRHCVRIEG